LLIKMVGRSLVVIISLLASAALNVLLFFILGQMNRPVAVKAPDAQGGVRLVRIDAKVELEERKRPDKKEEDLEAPEEELELDFDVPEEQLDHEPIETPLDLTVPSIAAVLVARPRERVKAKTSDVVRKPRLQEATIRPRRTGPRRADSVDRPPRGHLSNKEPKYPRGALRRRLKGAVTVRLLIDEAGLVAEVNVLRVIGLKSFEGAVLKVVADWRFDPAWHQGRFVKVWALKTIRFKPRR
jgi:periplasmic protein TonB